MKNYSGECLCTKTRYLITAKAPTAMFFCHCSLCRKETGTLFGANIFFENGKLSFIFGAENISFFNLKDTKHSRAFCKICASPLPREENGQIILPAGTLDEDYDIKPTAHIFFESKSSFEDELLNIPKFKELPK
jgi:hypothetical protein